MPLIENIIEFNEEDLNIINAKLDSSSFLHSNWGDEQLLSIRSKIRRFYRDEQVALCAYCNNDVSLISAGDAHVEHIVPKSIYRDFIFEPKNLCIVCCDCNTIKRNQEVLSEIPDTLRNNVVQYPRSSGAFKIVHPHYDNFRDHIKKKGRIFIDRTPKGLFTIGACKLNRYFHQFGVDDEFLDDDELTDLMAEFMDGSNSLQKGRALNRLRDILFEF